MKKLAVKILYIIILILLIASSKIINHISADSSNEEFTTGLKGQVFISPVSPVSEKGIVNKVPYEASLIFISSNNETIRKIQTEEDGKFEVALDAGKYTIIPESITKTGSYPIGEQKDIIIKSGEIAFVEIDFDSGIR
ncbi:MAG: hypothetical protein P8Z35_13705 [Ignavibacteriaceae bacterium]